MTFENLSELTTYLQRGISPKYEEIGIPVINQKCIRNGQLKREGVKFHSNQKNVSPEKYLLKNDILVNSTGVGTLGRVARVGETHGELVADSHVTIVRPNTELVDPLFLFYAMRLSEPTIVSLASGSTGQTELSRFALGALEIPKLEMSAQRFIATTLSAIDEKILVNQALSQTLENIAKSFFKSWFVDFDPVRAKMAGQNPVGMDVETASLFPDSMEKSDLGMIPKGWEVQRFGDLVVKQKVGRVYSSKESIGNGRVPILDQKDSGKVGFHNEPPGYIATPDQPVVVFGNHTCVIRLIPYEFSVIQNVFPLLSDHADTFWLYFALQGKQDYEGYKGHWPDFILHQIPVPPKELTAKFGENAKALFQLRWSLDNQAASLERVRDALLPRLISGEVSFPEETLAQ
jgi:type I restriction enzyme, S subunit